ncbi:MAG: transporter [Proteobacteria bacterium]|nr:transporter [Pseudomonadota bacterium]
MTRFSLLCALLLSAGAAQAQDRFSVGVGADYSTGDYGSDTTTEIFSVPLTAKYSSGNWTYKASIPWIRVQGDANVVPGLGSVDNLNPRGRGRGRVIDEPDAADTGSTSGIGDLRLAATYSFDTGGPLGIDLTGNAKIATADEDKGLGTGAEDYGIALDLYRDFAGTLVFGGAGYTVLGDSSFIEVDSVINTNAGASWAAGNGRVGLMYDWREAVTAEADDRSEITGFYSFPVGGSRLQVYGVGGLSDGSPEWGAGVSFSTAF